MNDEYYPYSRKTIERVRKYVVTAIIISIWSIILVILGLIWGLCLPGCVVVPAQYKTDEQGKVVMTQPERVIPAPITINTYPAPPVVYDTPVIYDYSPVVYRTYYPVPVVYQPSYLVPRPVYYGRTVYFGGRHCHRW